MVGEDLAVLRKILEDGFSSEFTGYERWRIQVWSLLSSKMGSESPRPRLAKISNW